MSTTLDSDSWNALYQAQLVNYETALGNDHNMDAKAGVVLAGLLAITVFALSHDIFIDSNRWQFALLIISLVLYVTALVLLIIGLFPKSYELPANPTENHPEYLEKDNGELMYQLVVDTELATKSITSRLRFKSILFSVATISFIVGTILLLIIKLIVGV
jgi:hypothetical protein